LHLRVAICGDVFADPRRLAPRVGKCWPKMWITLLDFIMLFGFMSVASASGR